MRGILVTLIGVTALVNAASVNYRYHKDPSEAAAVCIAAGSDGVLVAHERCDRFYKCSFGKPVALECPSNLLYNPELEYCDWPNAVDCGDRVIPDEEENTGSGNGQGDAGNNINSSGNCNPSDAPKICAETNSDGVLVAHERCDKFYKCSFGKPVALECPSNHLYNPELEYCDWPNAVDCGDRVIPDEEENTGSGNGQGDAGNNINSSCNCNPGDAPKICAETNSDGVLVAHERCDKFYKCSFGKPVALECPSNHLYNPELEYCDWPNAVDCGDRVIPDEEENTGSGNGQGDAGNNINSSCNCNPGDAPKICAEINSDGVLVAHERCDKFYKCSFGKPVALECPSNHLYNPELEYCDWPNAVDCGDRVIPDEEENTGSGNGQGDAGNNINSSGNCNPSDAPKICAAINSDGVLVAHERCDKFYKCSFGKPVALECPSNHLYNPELEYCDWPNAVDCGDRVIPDEEENTESGNGQGDAGNDINSSGNCNPSDAPKICAAINSDGVLVAHERCDRFYKCSFGKPVALECPANLLYNPELEYCDWPNAVDCGDRVIPGQGDQHSNESVESDEDKEVFDDSGHEDPKQALVICARPGSDGALIAHEHCTKFYKCFESYPVEQICPASLHYNYKIKQCDWPQNVDCGNRVIPDEEENAGSGSGQGDAGNNINSSCNCNPGDAPKICAETNSDGVLVAHEKCNEFYKCSHGRPTAHKCPQNLLYNAYLTACDWPHNVNCNGRIKE